MLSTLVYPPYKKSKSKLVPLSYNVKKNKMEGSEVSRADKYWKPIYEKIDKKYNTPVKILAKDTIIYRGSTESNPLKIASASKSPLLYFGLDFVISTWIALETYDRIQNDTKTKKDIHYYLHVYKLKQPLSYKYIYADKGTPIELDKRNALHFPCIHPQEILHGDNVELYNEVGTELTIPNNNKYNIQEMLTPLETLEVDVKQLQHHLEDYIFEWDPKNALFKPTDKKTSESFLGKWFGGWL